MATATIRRRLRQMQADLKTLSQRETPALQRLRVDPARLLEDAGLPPDDWQRDLLRGDHSRILHHPAGCGNEARTGTATT